MVYPVFFVSSQHFNISGHTDTQTQRIEIVTIRLYSFDIGIPWFPK